MVCEGLFCLVGCCGLLVCLFVCSNNCLLNAGLLAISIVCGTFGRCFRYYGGIKQMVATTRNEDSHSCVQTVKNVESNASHPSFSYHTMSRLVSPTTTTVSLFLLTRRFAKSESYVSSGNSIIPIHLYRYHLFVIVVRTHRNDNERCNRTASSPSYDFPLLLILSLAYIAGAQNCKPGGIFRRCSNKFRTFLLHRRYAVFLCRENEYFYASNTVANMLFILFLCEQDENCASTVAVMNQHTSLSVKTHVALW